MHHLHVSDSNLSMLMLSVQNTKVPQQLKVYFSFLLHETLCSYRLLSLLINRRNMRSILLTCLIKRDILFHFIAAQNVPIYCACLKNKYQIRLCGGASPSQRSLMLAKGGCFFRSFRCVPNAPLLQTVWGAEMVAGVGCGGGGQRSGHGGRPESIGSVMRWLCAR